MHSLMALLLFAPALHAADTTLDAARAIAAHVRADPKTYEDLAEFTAFGARPGGGDTVERAADWAAEALHKAGADRVWAQPVEVSHWVRGAESASVLLNGKELPLAITTLGGSVATSSGPIEAEVVEAKGLADLKRVGESVRGRIVFFNEPMDPALPDAFEAYGKAVGQRARGASAASALGAVAVLVRSMTTLTDDPLPHTGGVWYSTSSPKIPAAAVSTRDANRLSDLLRANPHQRVRLALEPKSLPRVVSRNIIGELKGRELPDDIVLVGGHLDSWDLGAGAHDDGAGVVESIEALRALKALNLRPKRTVRVVLFMSEELGGEGGKQYAERAKAHGEKHAAAFESDRGGFSPLGISADTTTLKAIESWKPYLAAAGAGKLFPGGGGTDTSFLGEQGVPDFELIPESKRYFDFHHCDRDRLQGVDRKELAAGAAAVSVFAYTAAELGIR